MWTDPATVILALGESAAPPADDPYLTLCCEAASSAAARKRAAAGYTDPPYTDTAPSPDVAHGATLWAVALWRGRVAVDSFPSFDELSGAPVAFGTWGEIRRLLGIGRAQVDAPPDLTVNPLRTIRERRRWGLRYGVPRR